MTTLILRDPLASLAVTLENANNTGPWIARGGYAQAAGDYDPSGEFPFIPDRLRIVLDGDDSSRADTYQSINRIHAAAVASSRPGHRLYRELDQRPRIEAGTPTEGQIRYSLISAAHVPGLDARHWAGQGVPVDVELQLMREPAWRRNTPFGYSSLATAATRQNNDYSTNTNYISWAQSNMWGADFWSPVKLTVTGITGTTGDQLARWSILAFKRDPLSGWTGLDTHLVATDAFGVSGSPSGGSIVTSTGDPVPGSEMWQLSASTDAAYAWIQWNLSAAGAYWGRWRVYAVLRESSGDITNWRASLSAGFGGLQEVTGIGDQQLVDRGGGTSQWAVYHMGAINLPPQAVVPSGLEPVSGYDASLIMRLWLTHSGTSTDGVEVAGLFLVPIDEWAISVDKENTIIYEKFLIDTDARICWAENKTGFDIEASSFTVYGGFPRIDPAAAGRLYYYEFDMDRFYYSGQSQLAASIAPMYKHLEITP